MRIAVIDLGTNTFHLLIGDLLEGNFTEVLKKKVAVKIGEGGISSDFITDEALERAILTMKEYHKIIEKNKVDRVFATATSAIRNAKNSQEVIAKLKEESGISVRVIDGLQEADYIYIGVKNALDIGTKPALIMDIGGGSIEFIVGNTEEVFWRRSFEIGGQRLIDQFHLHDPIATNEQAALISYLEKHLQPLFDEVNLYSVDTLIGSSGTFDTLSDIYCAKNGIERVLNATELPLTTIEFEQIVDDLILKNKEDRLKIPGMISLRVDMIVVAVILVRFIMRKLALQGIRVSSYALKEGLLLSMVDQINEENDILKG